MVGLFLSVGAGGAIGAIARYGVGVLLAARFGASGWIATLAVNMAGCFLMGMLAAYMASSAHIPEPLRGFLAVGFLGGLTTFSTFTLDGYGFWLRGDLVGAVVYIAASILLSLAGFASGFWLLRTTLGTA